MNSEAVIERLRQERNSENEAAKANGAASGEAWSSRASYRELRRLVKWQQRYDNGETELPETAAEVATILGADANEITVEADENDDNPEWSQAFVNAAHAKAADLLGKL